MEAIEEETSVMSGVTGTPNSSNQPIINETGRLELDLHDVCYFVTMGQETRHLLQNVNLHLHSGEMSALMGPSGAGKSTLLDLIADRKNIGTWTGQILVNQTPRSKYFNRISAYVLQDNCHISNLTVEETISYAAWTRLPVGTTAEMAATRVALILNMMGMTEKRNVLVANLSSGYIKRLSIAVEIIALPYILFLDEPTSGLDSATAFDVMNVVRDLSRRGRNCLTTIHQPSPEVFALFDRLVLLCAGRVIYSGKVKDASAYFTSKALGYPENPRQNPAEYVIDIAGGKILPLGQTVSRSDLELEGMFNASNLRTLPRAMLNSEPLVFDFVHVGFKSMCNQIAMLLHRGLVSSFRNTTNLAYILGKNIWLGILIGLVFRRVAGTLEEPFFDPDDSKSDGVTEFAGLLYFLLVYIWLSNGQIIPQCVEASKLYWREINSFAYVPLSYWTSIILTELPIMLFSHTIFISVVYLLCEFPNSADYYFFFWLILTLANLFALIFAQFLAFFTGSSLLAFAIYPVVFYVLGMFSSFTIEIQNLAPGWRWLCEVTFVRWAFQGMMVLEFDRYGGAGDEVLGEYSFDDKSKEYCTIVLVINVVVAAFLLLVSLLPPSRKINYQHPISIEDNLVEPLNGPYRTSELSPIHSPSLDRSVASSSGHQGRSLSAAGMRVSFSGFRDSMSNTISTAEQLLHVLGENLEIIEPTPHGYRDVADGAEDKFIEEDLIVSEREKSLRPVQSVVSNEREGAIGKKIVITCQNVGLILPSKKPRVPNKTLLYNVNGCVQPRQMCAVMGPSGAGKTALLDIIFGTHMGSCTVQGDVYFNNTVRTPVTQRRIAYVSSSDIHIPVLTVRETMLYAAKLRMQFGVDDDKKNAQVDQVLRMLGLEKTANTLVGNHLIRGISGGQKRRLSIGVEIVHFPDAILIDEATTGLDSATSDEVCASVRSLCDQDRTVILSIHQPSPITFKMFDMLLLLSEGRVLYFGPSSKAVYFFVESPFRFVCPEDMNPGDFVVAIAGKSLPTIDGSIPTEKAINRYYTHSQADIDAIEAVEHCEETVPQEEFVFELFSVYPTPRWYQIYILIIRQVTKVMRNKRPVRIGFLRHLLIGLLYGGIYANMDTGTDSSVYNMRFSLTFFSVLFITLVQQQTIPAYFDDKVTFDCERRPRIYSIFPYWLSAWLVYVPQLLVNTWTFGTLVYTMAGYRSLFSHYLFYILVLWITAMNGFGICQIVACLSPTAQTAMSVFPVIVFSLMSVAGYFIYLPDLDYWIKSWAPLFSPMRWSFQCLILNEFKGNSDLPLRSEYLEDYGFENVNKFLSLFYLLILCGVLFVSLIYAIRSRKIKRTVL